MCFFLPPLIHRALASSLSSLSLHGIDKAGTVLPSATLFLPRLFLQRDLLLCPLRSLYLSVDKDLSTCLYLYVHVSMYLVRVCMWSGRRRRKGMPICEVGASSGSKVHGCLRRLGACHECLPGEQAMDRQTDTDRHGGEKGGRRKRLFFFLLRFLLGLGLYY